MMATQPVVLKQATATCPTCGHKAHQIDTTKERAVEVVTKAMREHMEVHTVDLDIAGGIPVEGKGENSWDCGMDGIFGCSGRTVQDAVGNAVKSVLRDRERYGGPHNLPRPMSVSEAGGQR